MRGDFLPFLVEGDFFGKGDFLGEVTSCLFWWRVTFLGRVTFWERRLLVFFGGG